MTKVAGEFYCKVFHEIYGLPTISLRYFNVFGPRPDPLSQYAAVIPRFIKAILNDSSPIIFGDGQQSREFTFVKHVVDANVLAGESEETGSFNIARGRSISIKLIRRYVMKASADDRLGPFGDLWSSVGCGRRVPRFSQIVKRKKPEAWWKVQRTTKGGQSNWNAGPRNAAK